MSEHTCGVCCVCAYVYVSERVCVLCVCVSVSE